MCWVVEEKKNTDSSNWETVSAVVAYYNSLGRGMHCGRFGSSKGPTGRVDLWCNVIMNLNSNVGKHSDTMFWNINLSVIIFVFIFAFVNLLTVLCSFISSFKDNDEIL